MVAEKGSPAEMDREEAEAREEGDASGTTVAAGERRGKKASDP